MGGLYDTIFIISFTSTSHILTKLASHYFNEKKLFETSDKIAILLHIVMTLRGLSIQISLNHKIPVVTLANGTLIGGLSAKLFAYLYKIVMNIIPKCPFISLLFWKCKNLTFFGKRKISI